MLISSVDMMYFGIFIIILGFVFCIRMLLKRRKCLRKLREKELLEMQLQELGYKKYYRKKDRLYR